MTATVPKTTKFPRDKALEIACEVYDALVLENACKQITIAGSLRRGKPMVSDVELLYIPNMGWQRDPKDLFATLHANLADNAILNLENSGVLERRLNSRGSEVFGVKNKLMRHVKTGIPVDLFSTSEECWFNYLVCRTGPAESNIRIATEARKMGWTWHPYGSGFSRGDKKAVMKSEEEVFNFVRLPYFPPEQRT